MSLLCSILVVLFGNQAKSYFRIFVDSINSDKMKNTLLVAILAVLASLPISCQKRSVYNPELLQVEKQIEQSPDRALQWLEQNIPPNESSKANLALYYLLLTSAKDKTYAAHNSDSLISFAANYFAAKKRIREKRNRLVLYGARKP